MNRKTVSGIIVTLLLVGMLTLTFNIQAVKASGIIYIRADGSIDPPTAPISTVDNVTYIFTDNIYDSIVVERDNIVVDGAGYTVQGTGAYESIGVDLSGRTNVTVQNTRIKNFYDGMRLSSSSNNSISDNNMANNRAGIYLGSSSNSSIFENNIANNYFGVVLDYSSDNSISENNISENHFYGIRVDSSSNNTISGNNLSETYIHGIALYWSSNNSIVGNNIANNYDGIYLKSSSSNIISGNNIANNDRGIRLYSSSNNRFYHNDFIDNTQQVNIYTTGYANVWDDGYPSGGNYWSDYKEEYPGAEELDGSGIWDTPYVIDEDNQDNFPLMEPLTPSPPIPTTIGELKTEIEELGSEGEIDNQGIVNSLIAKLNAAQKLIEDGKIDQAKNILNAFINQVQAQSGKHITPEVADILIESAEHILSHL